MQKISHFFCLFPNKSLSLHHHLLTILKSIIMEQKEEKKKVEEQQLDQVNGGIGIPGWATSYPIVDKGVK